MTKRNINSNQGVIIIYQLNYDKLCQFHGLTHSCWLVLIRVDSCRNCVDSCWLNYDKLWQFHGLTDSCWLVLTRVDSCWTRVDSCWTRVDSCWLVSGSCWLVSDSCWFVLTRVDLCWYSCIRIDLMVILLCNFVLTLYNNSPFINSKKKLEQ